MDSLLLGAGYEPALSPGQIQIRGIMHLTYPDSDTHTGAVSTANAGETGAPEAKIEITPEMIEAGVCQYCSADDILETKEEIVRRVFLAMCRAKTMAAA